MILHSGTTFFRLITSPEWLIPIKKRGYFDPSNNPSPVEVKDNPGFFTFPVWTALDYLENVARRIDAADAEKLDLLMETIRKISDYRGGDGKRIQNYGTDWKITKVMAAVPGDLLTLDDFDRIEEFLKSEWRADMVGPEIGISLLPNVMKSGNVANVAKLFSMALGYKLETRAGKEEAVPLINEHWLGELLNKHLAPVSEVAPLEVATNVKTIMEGMIQHDELAFHFVAIPSIADLSMEGSFRSYETYLTRVLRDCLIAGTDIAREETRNLVTSLLNSGHDMFERMALHVIGLRWEVLNQEFWSVAHGELFTDPLFRSDLRQISRQNFGSFSEAEQEIWIDWIDSGPDQIPEAFEDSEEDRKSFVAKWKLRWLVPIKHFENTRANSMLEQCTEIVGTSTEDLEEGAVWTGVFPIESEEPRIINEFSQMTNAEIVARLKAEPAEQNRMERHDLERGFQKSVESEPQKYLKEIQLYSDLENNHQLALLSGITNAWTAGLTYEWNSLFDYCESLLSDGAIWENLAENIDREQIVSRIADLITEGTRNDSHAFDVIHLPSAEKLLLNILDRAPSTLKNYSDLDGAALNSLMGRTFSAAVNYSLRIARLNKTAAAAERWAEAIRAPFTRRLDGTEKGTAEFHYALGRYFANLYYLDHEWVESNIEKIFPKSDDILWKAAFSGYLLNANFYGEFYELLKSHNNYAKALDTSFEEHNRQERLVHHLCFAYLQGKEQIDDENGLFHSLISRLDPLTLQEIISFFWMRKNDDLEEDEQSRILAVWKLMTGYYENREDLSLEDKGVLSNSSKLTVFLDDINEESLGWLKLSAPYVDVGHDSPTFIKELDRLAGSSPKEVGEIFLQMLDNDVFPRYDMTHVESSVDKLYIAGHNDLANTICNLYFQNGFENLRNLFTKYNS